MVPYGLTGPTQLLKLVINIYSAQILEQKDTSIIDAVKKLFGQKQNENMSQVEQVSLLLFNDDEPKSKLNPFIRVSFGGLTVIKPFYSCLSIRIFFSIYLEKKPVYPRQKITRMEPFDRIHFQISCFGSFDQNRTVHRGQVRCESIGKRVLGTERYIKLPERFQLLANLWTKLHRFVQ